MVRMKITMACIHKMMNDKLITREKEVEILLTTLKMNHDITDRAHCLR